METDAPYATHRHRPEKEISRRLVGLLRAATGRGATTVRTTIGRDHVLVILEGTLTTEEQTLVANGHGDKVIEARHCIQQTLREAATACVEEVTGRTVDAFMSANHLDPDLAAEIFILNPIANV